MNNYSDSHKVMRVHTLMKVLQAIQGGETWSKSDIQEITGLSWGSCSEIISLFEEKKILVYRKLTKQNNNLGRKAKGFQFNEKQYLFIGLEVRQNLIVCSLVNMGKTELYSRRYKLKENLSGTNIFKQISEVYVNFLVDASVKTQSIMGVSVSLNGGVDIYNKKWIYSPRIENIRNIDMNQLIDFLPAEHYFNIEHDINAQALSVIHLHKWTYNNYVFLHFGEGIGMTFYNHGLYSGSRGLAGEIGHVPFNRLPKDRICDCGRKNCFETFLSVKGVLQLIHDFCGIKLKNLNEVDQSIISNSALNDFMKEAVSYILIFIKNILDPEQIIIGGEALEPFLPVIKTKIENKVNQESWLSGNNIIKWYSDKEINCAYGTVMTSCDKMIEQHIINNLI